MRRSSGHLREQAQVVSQAVGTANQIMHHTPITAGGKGCCDGLETCLLHGHTGTLQLQKRLSMGRLAQHASATKSRKQRQRVLIEKEQD